ncbi:hypothetical protein EJB05_47515, partial [Eragrostis curvula]
MSTSSSRSPHHGSCKRKQCALFLLSIILFLQSYMHTCIPWSVIAFIEDNGHLIFSPHSTATYVEYDGVSSNAKSFCQDADFPAGFHSVSRRSVRRRLLLQITESHQQELTLTPRGRRKRALLESTDDFPTDFQFSSSRRVRSRQLQNSSDYPRKDTPTIAESGEHHESAGTAVSNSAHKRK